MTKITIFGAGITGLSVAYLLPKSHTITIVARDLPGDTPTQAWASPWACAGWVALGGTPLEQRMQLDALTFLRKLAVSHPESGVVINSLLDFHDVGADKAEDLWSHGRVPEWEVLDAAEKGTQVAVRYGSVVINPGVFLPWIRKRLEEQGVRFERIDTVESLSELERFGGEVIVNSSGLASLTLEDVKDDKVIMDRTYVTVVKARFEGGFVRRGGGQYTYVFGRGDGTTVLGGISEPVAEEVKSSGDVRAELVRRAHENLPGDFKSADHEDYEFIEDLVGIRPLRLPEVRVEREVVGGQKVVHAYGTTIGGYIHSFGLAREVARLVDEYVFEA
ncbi:hypothetical protein OQA88_10706 [Cercophora sp. LCS_1]